MFCAVELRGVSGKTELLQVCIAGLDRAFTAPLTDGLVMSVNSKVESIQSHTLTHRTNQNSSESMNETAALSEGQQLVLDSLESCLKVVPNKDKMKMVESLCAFWRCKYITGDLKTSLTSISRRAGVQLERKMNKTFGDGLDNSSMLGGDIFSVHSAQNAYAGGMIRKLNSMSNRRRSVTSKDMDVVVDADFSQDSPN